MHLVLRSSKARGAWSFRHHDAGIGNLVGHFSHKHGVRVLSLANVGDHLHFQLKLTNRRTYRPFTRVVPGRRGILSLRDYVRSTAWRAQATGARRRGGWVRAGWDTS
jgi:hypothetical protein